MSHDCSVCKMQLAIFYACKIVVCWGRSNLHGPLASNDMYSSCMAINSSGCSYFFIFFPMITEANFSDNLPFLLGVNSVSQCIVKLPDNAFKAKNVYAQDFKDWFPCSCNLSCNCKIALMG